MNKSNIVLVGGKSGGGKTTLINTLIHLFPSIYARPISCTTRKKREYESHEEYDFISVEEFELLRQNGEFLNIDLVYGNYYAMKSQSINDILNRGMIPIKEVHPCNYAKIAKNFEGKVTSVLVKTSRIIGADSQRILEDNMYYDAVCEDDFDIVFFYDIDSAPEKNSKYFHRKISVMQTFERDFPGSGEIDKLNRLGYEKIAEYFTEERRITTRNFHELSATFFVGLFSDLINPSTKVLEIGPGHGWLYKTVSPVCGSYTCLDISVSMSKINPRIDKVTSSVRCINSPSEIYDVVVASLADSYFYPEAICEIGRVLKRNGYFAFSIPAFEWATALRRGSSDIDKTTFILNSSENAKAYSFTFPDKKLVELLDKAGFNSLKIHSLTGAGLSGNEISDAITRAAENIRKPLNALKIVTVAIFQKRGEDN